MEKDWQHELEKLTATIETLGGAVADLETQRQGLLLAALDDVGAREQVSTLTRALVEKQAEKSLAEETLPLVKLELKKQRMAAKKEAKETAQSEKK